jgi:hypothetical protein
MLASAPLSSCSPLRNLGPLRRLSWQYKEDSMRWLVVIAAILGCCGAAQAREPLARPMERTPSIMVDDRVQRPSKAKRQQKASPQASRTRQRQVNRTRSVVVPRLSNPYEAQTRSINSSIGSQAAAEPVGSEPAGRQQPVPAGDPAQHQLSPARMRTRLPRLLAVGGLREARDFCVQPSAAVHQRKIKGLVRTIETAERALFVRLPSASGPTVHRPAA